MKCYAFMWEDPLYVSNVLHHKISAYIILLFIVYNNFSWYYIEGEA